MSPGSEEQFPSSSSRNSTFESESSYYSYEDEDDEDNLPFFADATLDLEEAQGIACTPDPNVKSLTDAANTSGLGGRHLVPNLLDQRKQGQTSTNADDSVGLGARMNVPPPPPPQPMAVRITNRSVSSGSTQSKPLQRLTSAQVTGENSTTSPKNSSTLAVNAIRGGSMNVDMADKGGRGNGNVHSAFNLDDQPVYRPRPPHRPRDTRWTTTFFLSLPFLYLPSLLSPSGNDPEKAMIHQIHRADFYIIFTLVICLLLGQVFYLSRGGLEGDDRRHTAGQILLVANIASCGILPLLTISFYNLHVSGGFYTLMMIGLLYWTVKDIFFAARLFQSGRYIVEGVNDGQRAFFRMLVNASLDILSRSLRCQSFYRVIAILLILQLFILLGLRKALAHAIAMSNPFQVWWVFFVTILGYWCVNVVIRFLGYLACGGVTAWFAQQGALIEDIERMRRREEGDGFDDLDPPANTTMPEAYRNVHASAYSMGIEFDEGMDDDFGDDDVVNTTISTITGMNGLNISSGESNTKWEPNNDNGTSFRSDGAGNVKSFCTSAIKTSFGSIVQCAIVGGFANLLWDFLRTVEWIASLSSRFAPLRPGNFQGMAVGADTNNGSLRDRFIAKWRWLIAASRAFVRNRNDLALCHVVAYYKGYNRAANDVMNVIDISGESVIWNFIFRRVGRIFILISNLIPIRRHRTNT
jgi:hypothetical protein